MTTENDLVLIHIEDQPLTYARIESILADHKPDWYHVKLLMLQVPLQVVTWILKDVYIAGEEFTMGGKRMRLAKVVPPPDPDFLHPVSDEDAPPPTDAQLSESDGPGATAPQPPADGQSRPKPGKVITFPPKK